MSSDNEDEYYDNKFGSLPDIYNSQSAMDKFLYESSQCNIYGICGREQSVVMSKPSSTKSKSNKSSSKSKK